LEFKSALKVEYKNIGMQVIPNCFWFRHLCILESLF